MNNCITFDKLCDIIRENDIPGDVELMSDSGWECDATDVEEAYYRRDLNIIIFTQYGADRYHPYVPHNCELDEAYPWVRIWPK